MKEYFRKWAVSRYIIHRAKYESFKLKGMLRHFSKISWFSWLEITKTLKHIKREKYLIEILRFLMKCKLTLKVIKHVSEILGNPRWWSMVFGKIALHYLIIRPIATLHVPKNITWHLTDNLNLRSYLKWLDSSSKLNSCLNWNLSTLFSLYFSAFKPFLSFLELTLFSDSE